MKDQTQYLRAQNGRMVAMWQPEKGRFTTVEESSCFIARIDTPPGWRPGPEWGPAPHREFFRVMVKVGEVHAMQSLSHHCTDQHPEPQPSSAPCLR